MKSALVGQRDLLVDVAAALNARRIPYLLSGSFASSFYGIPRATHDIDFVVEIGNEQLTALRRTLEELGREFAAAAKELTRVAYPQMVNTWHGKTGLKIDFWITVSYLIHSGGAGVYRGISTDLPLRSIS